MVCTILQRIALPLYPPKRGLTPNHAEPRNIIAATTSAAAPELIIPTAFPAVKYGDRPRKRARIARKTATLLIDNYDSYTYNLFQLIAKVTGDVPTVIQNDELSWRELSRKLLCREFDHIVISPGPGTPLRPSDIGVCGLLLEEAENTPILGVCLGMQALAYIHGGHIIRAPEPIHGRLSQIQHSGNPIFADIPSGCNSGFEVVRYHSLAVSPESLPACLEPIAWTCGRHQAVNLESPQAEASGRTGQGSEADEETPKQVLMGIAHRSRPHWGMQFHPESVATTHGATLLHNFMACSEAYSSISSRQNNGKSRIEGVDAAPIARLPDVPPSATSFPLQDLDDNLDVRWRVLKGALGPLGGAERIFWNIFGQNGAEDTFWLDSASLERQRFSFLGGKGGPLWRKITFKLAQPAGTEAQLLPGCVTSCNAAGSCQTKQTHFLDFLEAELLRLRCCKSKHELPFDFLGGFVGYLGYELKAECGASGPHVSPHPDAAMFFADRIISIDHATDDIYLVALHEDQANAIDAAETWLEQISSKLRVLPAVQHGQNQAQPQLPQPQTAVAGQSTNSAHSMASPQVSKINAGYEWENAESLPFGVESRRSREGYTSDVTTCLESLRAGESYELCLTTKLRRKGKIDPKELYSRLRASNPSAHAAWLNLGQGLPVICCSSPERFLRGFSDGSLEARPIKGTARRYISPELDQESKDSLLSSPKARAENLMIVDLLRNDLGRVCEVGSVHVPGLMEVESYFTVHNLVSTVRGQRRKQSSIVDCLRACFPGGSMTGAPKRRSINILDRLENGPRGVYSGSLGFIGVNNTFSLNIIIRTAVVTDTEVTIGAGGAIVLQSDPEEEYEEMRLKASALLGAINDCSAQDID